jgi:type II secretory pathway pseudopilin PulG
MIAVAIMGFVAAIAIPFLSRVRINANEGAVKPDLRTFSFACESYRAMQSPPVYPEGIDTLTTSTPPYLDTTWGEAQTKHGFTMTYLRTNTSYSLLATAVPGAALNNYCVDQTGAIVGSINGEGAPVGEATGCAGGTALGG